MIAAFAFTGAAAQNLKVLSYNILEGMKTDTTKGKQLFVEWVKDKNPDVVALQECNGFTQKSLEELAASWGHNYAVIVKETGYPTGITSKYPIINIEKTNENMTHGFITCWINGYNFCVLHLNPHKYLKKRAEIAQVLQTLALRNPESKWLMMGDFNSLSPLDSARINKSNFVERVKETEKKLAHVRNLEDGVRVDYKVQQAILDAGFIDAGRQYDQAEIKRTGNSTIKSDTRIDYIYLSKDLAKNLAYCHFIYDDFTKVYSDHKPIIMEIKK